MQIKKHTSKFFLFLLPLVLLIQTKGSFAEEIDLTQSPFYSQKRYSQHREEDIIRHFFKDEKNGVFVDVGASDYQKFNNTYYLEKNLNWSGVAIDALSQYADDYKKYRPKTKFFTYYVSNRSDGMQKFFKAKINEVSSGVRQWMKAVAPRVMMNWKKDEEMPYEEIEVPRITLNKLLSENKIDKVDMVNMDIELSEPEALAGFDIKKYRPRLVCIETQAPVRKWIMNYFANNGYEPIAEYLPYDNANTYFRPKPTQPAAA